jgi:enoyl-CoA hydratase/carnithine racemase
VGISKALEWCYSGRVFDASEAHAGGLVRSVHAPGALMSEARTLAREIAQNTSAVSVALTRAMMWRLMSADHPMEAHKIDSRAIYSLARSEDAKEGIASFLEKRRPNYPGKVSEDMPGFYPWWEPRRYE